MSLEQDLDWQPDVLGEGYKVAMLDMGKDPDSGKPARAALVHHTRATPDSAKPALLWVHGVSDYFFQTHVAEEFAAQGHAFYALDLRRCGRAHQHGEHWHYTSDLSHYFGELTTALRTIAATHGQVVPIAHSTGGLIVALWADHLRKTNPADHALLAGVILNSPWLDLQYPRPLVRIAKPFIKLIGKFAPLTPLPSGGEGTYGASIHAGEHGEWRFNTEWKPIGGHRKYFGWLRTVINGQTHVQSGNLDTGAPTLTLASSHSYLRQDYSPAADTADTVLDVRQIRRWAPKLSEDSVVRSIDGARHDVFLSQQLAREAAFRATSQWLNGLGAANTQRH